MASKLDERWAALENDAPLLLSALKLAVLFVIERRAAKSAARPLGPQDVHTVPGGRGDR